MAKSYRISPSIGIARIGDSKTEHYLAPDTPQRSFVPPGGYRDRDGKIKRMGQTFRIYEYEGDTPVREITSREADIVWLVELRNSKPSKEILNRQIPRDSLICRAHNLVRGPNGHAALSGKIRPGVNPITIKLGDISTNNAGQLVVLGGHGSTGTWDNSEPSGIQNSGWWDDTSDGPVGAMIQFPDSDAPIEVEPAWVIIGVPDFAHPVEAIVTLYDLVRDLSSGALPPGPVSFTREIFPVLSRAVLMQWVSQNARSGHAAGRGNFLSAQMFPLMHNKDVPGGQAARKAIFERLKNPSGGGGNMPNLGSLSLTPLQHKAFERWANNDFNDDWDRTWDPQSPPEPALRDIPLRDQPDALNRAALGSGIGGSFNPGIEAGMRVAQRETYIKPFCVSPAVEPGALTHDLGVPWQSDFIKFCPEYWWPSGRPDSVSAGGQFKDWTRGVARNREMVEKWSGLGFIVREPHTTPPRYVEAQRTLPERFTLDDVVKSFQASFELTKEA